MVKKKADRLQKLYNCLRKKSHKLIVLFIFLLLQNDYCVFFFFSGGRHSADLRQIPRKERRSKGAVRQGPSDGILPRQVLGRP